MAHGLSSIFEGYKKARGKSSRPFGIKRRKLVAKARYVQVPNQPFVGPVSPMGFDVRQRPLTQDPRAYAISELLSQDPRYFDPYGRPQKKKTL